MGKYIVKKEAARAGTIVGPRHLRNEQNIENNAKCDIYTKKQIIRIKMENNNQGNGIILGDKMIMGEKKMSRRILEAQCI